MTSNIQIAIQLTIIGMGLVFISLTIIWAATIGLVAVFKKQKYLAKVTTNDHDLKMKAAIAAVVVALARENDDGMHEFPLPPTAFVSAWQAVMRANVIKKRGQVR